MGTDGLKALLVDCATEDPNCELERCAHSVLSNQLWYHSSTTQQLMSSYTVSAIPPLGSSSAANAAATATATATATAAAAATATATAAGWGPTNASLINIPLCLYSGQESCHISKLPHFLRADITIGPGRYGFRAQCSTGAGPPTAGGSSDVRTVSLSAPYTP